MKKLLLAISLLLLSVLQSSELEFHHQCARPIKPVNITGNSEVWKYNNDMKN